MDITYIIFCVVAGGILLFFSWMFGGAILSKTGFFDRTNQESIAVAIIFHVLAIILGFIPAAILLSWFVSDMWDIPTPFQRP